MECVGMKVGHISSEEALEMVGQMNEAVYEMECDNVFAHFLEPFELSSIGHYFRILWNGMEVYNSESSEHGWDEETNDYQYSVMDVIRQNMESCSEQLRKQWTIFKPGWGN